MSEPIKLDLRSVRYLLAIAAHGSYARAAAALHVTQPALSRSIQALEKALGVTLFDRGRAGVFPTVFGRVLLASGKSLLANASAIERELRLLAGADVGKLLIGAGMYPTQISVGRATARLVAQHPALEVRICIGDWPDLIERVLAEELDLAICEYAGWERDERVVIEALPGHKGRLFCRAGHPAARARSIDLATVQRFPLVLTTISPRAAALADRPLQAKPRPLTPAIHVDTFDLAREIVLGSDAIGAATPAQIADDVRTGRLQILPIERPWIVTRYGFVHRAGRTLSPAAQAFMALVRDVEAEIHEAERGGSTARPADRKKAAKKVPANVARTRKPR